MTKRGYIYKYTFSNGKVYIGQTRVSVKERHYQHMSASRDPNRRTLCEAAILKYGEPTCETIETIEVDDHEELKLSMLLDEAERKWINYYDSTTKSGKGYNVQEGGKMFAPQEFLLKERWNQIFEEQQWGESISYVKYLLESIGTKICITKEKLTKEEKSIWYGYKFHEYWDKQEGKEITFYSYYRDNLNNPFLCNIGDVPYELREIIHDEKSTIEEREKAEQQQNKVFFDNIMKEAIEEHWIEDIRDTIWKQVMKEKKSVLRKFEKESRTKNRLDK